jgi:hypothetical protein
MLELRRDGVAFAPVSSISLAKGGVDMAEHEPCIGQSDDWHTPPEIFEQLGLRFDLAPCAPTAAS